MTSAGHEILPAVILWDPNTTYPQFVTSRLLKCETCAASLSVLYWLDGKTSSKQPRILHSIESTVLLVSAVYGCVNKHKMLAHDEAVLQCFPAQHIVPFVLFHRTGFTREFADTCLVLLRRGVNFHNMESIILERRWETFSRQNMLYQHSMPPEDCHTSQDFFSSELAKSPSDSMLTKCFLATFLKEEQAYLSEIASTNIGDTISFDHTFEVATNIGYLREDGTWIPLYDSLFLVLNSAGKIVTWQLTKGTSLSQVEQVLRELHDHAEQQQCKIKTVYIDNCCSLRKKVQCILGNNTNVKLDVFHAVQRIVRTLPKRHSHYHKCLEKLRLVFRTDGDSGKERVSATPPPDVMLRNMDRFIHEWKEVKSASGVSIFSPDALRAIQNLRKHIRAACLSNIPPGGGTNRNERFHRHIKSYFNRSRVGVLLAYALMTVIIHSHNNAQKINGKYVSRPIRASPHHMSSPIHIPSNTIGISPKMKHTESLSESWEVDVKDCQIDIDKVRLIYKCCLYKLHISWSLASMKLTQLQKAVFSLRPFSATTDTQIALEGNLQRMLSEYGLTCRAVAKDGNCFFMSVALNMMQNIGKWAKVMEDLGISQPTATSSMTLALELRKIFVSELLGDHFPKYYSFMDMDVEDFRCEAHKFLCDGYYNSELGDVMPLALATALNANLLIFTSSRQMYITPESESTAGTVFVVYDQTGTGHYDAALPFNSSGAQNVKKGTSVYCKCGVNSAPERQSCIPLSQYNTRCKCYKESRSCCSHCRCKNCANPHGSKQVITLKRKRTPHDLQIPLPVSKIFAVDRGEAITGGCWSEFETIVLMEIFYNHEKEDKAAITKLFNDIAYYSTSLFCVNPLPEDVVFRQRSLHQIQAKLKHVCISLN